MTEEEINSAIDQIRNATSTETAGNGATGEASQTLEIVLFAAPGNNGLGQIIEAITGPPAILPFSDEENATSSDAG